MKYNGKFPFLCFYFFSHVTTIFFLFTYQLWSFAFNLRLVSTLRCRKQARYKFLQETFVPRVDGSASPTSNDTKVFFSQTSLGTFFYVDFCFIYVSNGKFSEIKKKKKKKNMSAPYNLPFLEYNGKFPILCFDFFSHVTTIFFISISTLAFYLQFAASFNSPV